MVMRVSNARRVWSTALACGVVGVAGVYLPIAGAAPVITSQSEVSGKHVVANDPMYVAQEVSTQPLATNVEAHVSEQYIDVTWDAPSDPDGNWVIIVDGTPSTFTYSSGRKARVWHRTAVDGRPSIAVVPSDMAGDWAYDNARPAYYEDGTTGDGSGSGAGGATGQQGGAGVDTNGGSAGVDHGQRGDAARDGAGTGDNDTATKKKKQDQSGAPDSVFSWLGFVLMISLIGLALAALVILGIVHLRQNRKLHRDPGSFV